MNLSTLQNFITAAEILNFSKAAELEFISQPALSRRIAALERELGVPLFERGGRGVELTHGGRVLLEEARALLEKADGVVGAVRGIVTPQRPDFSLGLSAGAGVRIVADLLCQLRSEAPNVVIDVRTGDLPTQLGQLGEGTLDVVFGQLPSTFGHRFESLPLCELQVDMLVEASHAVGDRASISAFACNQILIPTGELGDQFRSRFVDYCIVAGFQPSLSDSVGTFDTVAAIQIGVAMGQGVGLIPRDLARDLPPNTRLVKLSPSSPPYTLGFAWSPQNQSPFVDRLLELAGAHGEPVEPLRWPEVAEATIVAA